MFNTSVLCKNTFGAAETVMASASVGDKETSGGRVCCGEFVVVLACFAVACRLPRVVLWGSG